MKTPLIIVDGYVYRAVENYVPVRDVKGGPLRMERYGWKSEGAPLAKIIFHDSPTRKNPVLDMLLASGMIVDETTKGY